MIYCHTLDGTAERRLSGYSENGGPKTKQKLENAGLKMHSWCMLTGLLHCPRLIIFGFSVYCTHNYCLSRDRPGLCDSCSNHVDNKETMIR